MTFDNLLAGLDKPGITIPASWGQGRATFGGLVAALVYEKMQATVSDGRPLRGLQVAFVGPVAVEQPCEFSVTTLREGKTATQVQGYLLQDGAVKLAVLGSFGGQRESTVQVESLPAPDFRAMDECPELPLIENVTPGFTRHIEMRWAIGDMPFTGKANREMGGWMRFREPGETMTDAHIIALADAWPPAVLQHLTKPAPASSMNWSLELIHPRPAMAADETLLYRACIDQASGGYGHTHATIWTQSGELVALSRQVVTVFG